MPPSSPPKQETIGFFGGSYDPIHNGHAELARELLAHAPLERILLCPAHQAPLRDQPHHASPAHRLAMVAAAVENQLGLEATDVEIKANGISYTRDTLRNLRDQRPDSEIHLILGSDQLARLPKWRHIEDLIEEIEFLVLARPGHKTIPPLELPNLRHRTFSTPEFDISSTDVRKLVREGQSFEHLVPLPVSNFIKKHNLYR